MMANKIAGLTVEISGDTTKLSKALGDVNKNSRDLQRELKDIDRLLKLDPKNTDLLNQKQKVLGETIGNTKEKLVTLKEAEKQAQEQFRQGKIGEDQYRAIQREVIKTEEELKKVNKQLKEMDWKGTTDKLDKFGNKSVEIGKNLTTKVTLPILAAGGAAYKMAADAEDAIGATDQIFKGAAGGVKEWASNLESYYGIATGEAHEYANMMGTMLVNIGGLTEEEAAKQAETLIELAGDLTAMYGGTTADAVQALTGALKGNNTMLDNYGMAANDASIKTKAFEMGLYSGKGEMDLATKQAATLALIMEQSGAAQGQAAREAEGASGSMRAMATEVKNLSIEFGQVLLPLITPLIAGLKDLIKWFGDLSPGTKKVVVGVLAVLAAIGPLLIIVGKLSLAVSSIITLFGAGGAAAGVLGGAIGFLTGPIGIAIAAIAAIIAIGITLYKNWDTIKAKAGELYASVKDKFDKIKAGITNAINGAKDAVGAAVEKIKGFFNFEWKLPKIKIPHFKIGWDSSGLLGKVGEFFGLPGKPVMNVEWYKTGGVFTKPQVIGVGEGGEPEGVFPLSYLKNLGLGEGRTVNHTGTITVRGVNNEGQLVAVVEQAITNKMMQDNRRLPNRASIIPL